MPAVRVALDVTPLLGVRSGVATVVDGLLRALASTPGRPELVPWTLSGRDRSGAGVGAVSLPLPAAIAVPLWNRIGRPRVDRHLDHPDVIHGTNYVVPPATAARVVSVYDLSFLGDPTTTSRSIRRFDATVRAAVRSGAWIHTTAEVVAVELRERYGGTVVVVPPGIEPRPMRETPTGPRAIVAVGTAVPRKNLPLLVDAFALLAADRSDLELSIVGAEGPDSPAIAARLAALPPDARARARHLGRLPDDALARVVEEATVLAHPSSYEGFGLPVLEAMSAGVPVVAAAAGAVPEVAGDAAILVEADDVEAMAAGLAVVLDDADLARQRATRGRDRAARFDWETAAAAMLELYERCREAHLAD